MSAGYALAAGADETRALIRILYYLGIFATLAFAYEMGRKPEAYEILLKGLVIMGIVYAVYGAYQIVAFYTGLPVRGIVYNASGESIMAFEGGLLRINSDRMAASKPMTRSARREKPRHRTVVPGGGSLCLAR